MEEPKPFKSSGWDVPYLVTAGLIGLVGVFMTKAVLAKLFGWSGNPVNMGFCMSCFLRDVAGSLGLHKAAVAWYFRPEIPGLILGAFGASLLFREFKPKGGRNPLLSFFFGAFMGLGAMMFLGCTTRMGLRLGGGDLNALVGFASFATGIFVGTIFLKRGFEPGERKELAPVNGIMLPFIAALFLGIFLIFGDKVFKFSVKGPGAIHAPVILSIAAGLFVGAVGYWGRFCFMRPFRELFLLKSGKLLGGIVLFVALASIANLAFGQYRLGLTNQADRLAHSAILCNFLGMFTVGLAAVFLDGCPIRQVIRAGSGDADAGVVVMGMIAALSLADNFGFSCSPKTQPFAAGVAVDIGIGFMLVVALFNSDLGKKIVDRFKNL
jgi:YedE family putative selenium metabolism protein